MQVNKTTKPSFNGIYRIKNTPKNIEEVQNIIIPLYKACKEEPIIMFVGSNPLKSVKDALIQKHADKLGYSVEWLKANAQNFGASLWDFESEFLHVVSSRKDYNGLMDYLNKRISSHSKFLYFVKEIFKGFFKHKEKPEHLRDVFRILDLDKQEDIAFSKQFSKRIKDTNSIEELSSNLLQEK